MRLQRDPDYRVALYKSLPLGEVNAFIWHICQTGHFCDQYLGCDGDQDEVSAAR